jgi:endonuclease/exonuclease/phosphatase family metal-dependent hydrolase
MLYNVRYCAGVGLGIHLPLPLMGYLRPTNAHLDRVTEFIGAQQPDIVGLIEVDAGSYRSGRRNQAEVIAKALGHFHSYESKYAESSFARWLPVMNKQVNAFLSNDVIHGARFHYFDQGVKRLAIELELEDLTVFLVHLSLKYRHRQGQLGELYNLVREVRKPHIVAGDFNAFWGDREIELFMAATGLRNANTQGAPSYPSWSPRRQLDFVLHSPEIRVTAFSIPQVRLSDHLPLVCDFEIGG